MLIYEDVTSLNFYTWVMSIIIFVKTIKRVTYGYHI